MHTQSKKPEGVESLLILTDSIFLYGSSDQEAGFSSCRCGSWQRSLIGLSQSFFWIGIGNSTGTGAATAWVYVAQCGIQGKIEADILINPSRVFTKAGYHIACIGRSAENLSKFSKEITEAGGYVSYQVLSPLYLGLKV